MNRSLFVLITASALLFAAGCAGNKTGSSAGAASPAISAGLSAPDAARRERLLDTIKFKYPRIADYKPAISELHESEFKGLDAGVLEFGELSARQKQGFLVSHDDKKLYMLAGDPFDASRNIAEVKAEKQAEMEKLEAGRRAEMAKLVAGQPVRGNPSGKVVVVEYSDFQCPYCRQAYLNIETMLKSNPEVRFYYLHFPLSSIHPWAQAAAIHGVCAARQGGEAFWRLHDGLFIHQSEITAANLHQKSLEFINPSPKFDAAAFTACANDPKSAGYQSASGEVKASSEMAQKFGIDGTPGFIIDGKVISGVISANDLSMRVAEALKN